MQKIQTFGKKMYRRAAHSLKWLDTKWKAAIYHAVRLLYKIKPLRPLLRPVGKFAHAHSRITAVVMVVIIAAGVFIPVMQSYYHDKRYELDAHARALLGEVDNDLKNKLSFNQKDQVYQFNKDGKKESPTSGNPLEKLTSQVGGGGENDEQLYSVDASKDLRKGVTYYDNNMQLSFKVTPQLKTMPAEIRDGHIIYPLIGMDGQVAYSAKSGGMKENIILYKSQGDTMRTDYVLDLPKSLEARLTEAGDIGIYSADPALFGQISYGSSDDQAKVENARNNSEKTFLTFTIPAPVVMGLGKTNQAAIANVKSKFELNKNILSVVTTGLAKAEYPLSIDPSISVTSSSDFKSGNIDDDNTTVDNGDLKRSSTKGGSLGGWNSTTNVTTTNGPGTGVAAYNGFVYVTGGGSGMPNVMYAPINSDGTIGSWNATTAMPVGRTYHAVAIYNGYLYVTGGRSSGCGTCHNIDAYAVRINSDGTLGSWSQLSNMPTARSGHTLNAYNGYMYMAGGVVNLSTATTAVYYAPINANGTLGTWVATTSLGVARTGHSSFAYNGFIYILGGNSGTTNYDTVVYAPINSDGSIGSWLSTTSFVTARTGLVAAVHNGYVYITGGINATTRYGDVQYAPINTAGGLGSWATTTSMTVRSNHAAFAYNGYLYVLNGLSSAGSYINISQYAKIGEAGAITSFQSTPNTFTTERYGHASVAYNGYIYVLGGHTGNNLLSDIQYAAINADGTLGTWASAGSTLPSARYLHSASIYNGYIYVVGGNDGVTALTTVSYKPINANGTINTGTWTAATSLPSGSFGHASVVYGNYLYVSGGYNGSVVYDTVRYIQLTNTGATTGSWQTSTYTTGRWQHASVAANGYLYIIGGSGGSTLGDIQYAQINTTTGALGTWATTTALAGLNARYAHGAAFYNGYLYLVGGYNTNGSTNSVIYNKVNSDGTLGATWTDLPGLMDTYYHNTSIAYNGYLYSLGGYVSGATTDAEFARINNGGNASSGTWTTSGNSLPSQLSNGVSAVYNGRFYEIGGNAGAYTNQIRYASFTKTGDISSWTTNAINLPVSITQHNATIYNGYMYLLGGWDGTTNRTQVYYAPINADGSVGSWTATTSMSGGRAQGAAVGYNGYLYVISGEYSTSGEYAPINPNGSIGTWTATTNYNGSNRADISLAINNGYMYISGGWTGSARVADVEFAKINANGSLSSWSRTTAMPQGRSGHEMNVANGYLYVSGGSATIGGSAAYLDMVIYAPINSNGTIGEWQKSFTSFGQSREQHEAAIYNGYLYIFGGWTGSARRQDVQYAPLNLISRTAKYSKTIDLGSQGTLGSISYSGSLRNGLNDITYRMAGSDGIFGTTKASTLVGCSSGSTGRYIQVQVTLDDTEAATFGDDGPVTLNSITVETLPAGVPTNQRLKHGAWFSGEVLQPLQTSTVVCG